MGRGIHTQDNTKERGKIKEDEEADEREGVKIVPDEQ